MQNNTDTDKTQTNVTAPAAGKFYRVSDNFFGDLHDYVPTGQLACHFVEGIGPWAGNYAAHLSFDRADTFCRIGDCLAEGSRCAFAVLEPIHRVGAGNNAAEFMALLTNGHVIDVHVDSVGDAPADQAAGRVLHLLRGGRLDLCRLGASSEEAALYAGLMISRIVHREAWFEFGRRFDAGEPDPPRTPVVNVAALPAWRTNPA